MISAFRLSRVVVALTAITVAAGLASMQSPPIARGGTNGLAYTVNTTADNETDDSQCSLREAIRASNMAAAAYSGCTSVSNPGTDDNAISFSLGAGNPKIDILTPLPAISRAVAINGATGGATRVELHGPGGPFQDGFNGLRIATGGAGSVIKSLVINNFPVSGIDVAAANVIIIGNRIGTDAAGSVAVPNLVGIYVTGSGTQIGRPTGASLGGSCTGDCNLLSGNSSYGIQSSPAASNTMIRANFIGTDVSGTADLGNGFAGIWASDGIGLQIGGLSSNESNLVSGNGDGILAYGPAAEVLANRVGTNSAGDAAIPNSGRGLEMRGANNGNVEANLISGNGNDGLFIVQSSGVHVRHNLIGVALDGVSPLGNLNNGVWIATASVNYIGSTNASDANTIAFNTSDGVRIDAQSAVTSGNAVRGNSIHDNDGLGINNINGGNGEPPPPVITAATPSGASGTAPSCGPCAIEVYSDNADEGRVYEGTTQTDLAGSWSFVGSLAGPKVTAVSTNDGNSSSEFSAPVSLPATPTPSPTPSPTPTITPTATASPTATPSATATPTPTATAGQQLTQGDVNCANAVNHDDFWLLLQYAAKLQDGVTPGGCPNLSATIGGFPWGDVNCDGVVDAIDALYVLAYQAGIFLPVSDGCDPIGSRIT